MKTLKVQEKRRQNKTKKENQRDCEKSWTNAKLWQINDKNEHNKFDGSCSLASLNST